LSKKEFNKNVTPLLRELETYEKSNSIAFQVANKYGQKVEKAINHLKDLKEQKPVTKEGTDKNKEG